MFLRAESAMPLATLIGLCVIALARGTGTEQCQSLVTVDSCQPWANCSGLQCPKASFMIFKCQDPVVVQLTVNNNTLRLTESSEVQLDENHSVSVSILRDENNLFFNATQKDVLIVPNVVIPLNTSDCMCRSLQQLSSDIQNSIPQLSCSTDLRCHGVLCTLPASLYGADMAVLPCRSPPGLRISLADAEGHQIYSGVFDRSQNASVSSLLMLNVVIVQRKYSMDVQVSASSPLYGTFSVIPKRTIILDKSNCSVNTVTPPASSTPTCQALQNLQYGLPACYLNQACSGLNCAVLGLPYTVSFEVEPCTQPASILVTVRDATGAVLYNSSINDTTTLPLGPSTALSVVVRQLPNALGLKVDLVLPSSTVNIIPFYTIPINQSECNGSESGAPTTPVPQAASQCDAFNTLSASTQRCVTNAGCDGVVCSLLGYKTAVSTLPCNSPPAVTVVVVDSNNTVLFTRTVDQTQQMPLVGGATLLVTVNQLTEAIGMEVDLQTPVGAVNIIPYTVIPLNTTNCSHAHPTPPSPLGTTCDTLTNLTLARRSCSTNVACDEVDCSVQGYTTAMVVLPCNSPPAIRLTVKDSNGTTLFYQTLSHSRKVPLLGGTVTLVVTVDQLDNALGVRLDLSTLFGTGTIIPYTVVPINTSSCPPTQAPPTSPPEVTTTCAALSSVMSSNPTCLTNVACDSLTCAAFGLSTRFTVLPCNAPPAIAVSVSDSNGTSLFSQTLSQSRLVPLFGGALTLVVTVDQLSNSLGLEVDAVSVFGGSVNLIPYTVIPLNTSNCGPTGATPSIATQPNTTCSALSAISAMGQGCSVTPSCNEVDCVLLGYSTGFLVLPCNTPPAVGIMVNDTRNTTLFYQVISQTQQISLFGLTTLDVTVVQLSNALGLKVDVIPLPGSRVNVIPYTVIPLNTTNCGPTRAPPTSSPPTNTTCGALSTIAAANQACSPTADCWEVDCSYLNYTIGMAVVPCSTPPGVTLSVTDPRGTALYSETLTRSQNITIVGGLVSVHAMVDQLNGSLGVKVDAISPLGVTHIVPYTVVPLNTSNCTSNSTLAPPTPAPPDACRALGDLADSVQSCIVTPACDGMDCIYSNDALGMRLLPCEVPPSLRLWAYEQNTGKVLFNRTVSQSQQIGINSFATLDVTIVQMPNAIGLKGDLVSPLSRVNLIPFTVLPISTAGCNVTAHPGSVSWSVTSPSPVSTANATTGAAEQEFHIGVIVGVPLGVVLTLLLASALAVVGVALRRHYRKIKARSYRLMETTDATCMTNLDGESD